MLGAIVGDIIGSPYEFTFNNIKTKDFPLFSEKSCFTDDTIHTLAIANAMQRGINNEVNTREYVIDNLHNYTKFYDSAGYGSKTIQWVMSGNREPYYSNGNGCAMRVSSVGFIYNTLEEVEKFAKISAEISHNHPEGIKGAVSVASAIFLARTLKGSDKEKKNKIKEHITQKYKYNLDRKLENLRENYIHDETCENSVPQAITAFLLSSDYEDCIRNAISIGGDSDTIGAIAGGIAEAFYGEVPKNIAKEAKIYLDDFILEEIEIFYSFLKKRKSKMRNTLKLLTISK